MLTATMEPLDLSAVLTPDFWFQQFTNFEGLHTGVPTRTTPTLTPTTLRNIEQTFIEFQPETERAESHHNEAGFVPPVIEPTTQGGTTYMSLVDSKGWLGGSTTVTPVQAHSMSRPTVVSSAASVPIMQSTTPTPSRRNMGGRRPMKNAGISPEEEERRRIRRERNKLAAARCRKRRMDHTNDLLKETESLEKKKMDLQYEIQQLQIEKDHLEFILQAHKETCRLSDEPPSPPDIKPLIFIDEDTKVIVQTEPRISQTIPPTSEPSPPKRLMLGSSGTKPSRPSSLPVAPFTPHKPATTVLEVAGVPITTPSAGIPFNFDSLMEGGTGLTPVSGTGLTPMIPSCSSQQRNGGVDLSSPDATYPPKLVSL